MALESIRASRGMEIRFWCRVAGIWSWDREIRDVWLASNSLSSGEPVLLGKGDSWRRSGLIDTVDARPYLELTVVLGQGELGLTYQHRFFC